MSKESRKESQRRYNASPKGKESSRRKNKRARSKRTHRERVSPEQDYKYQLKKKYNLTLQEAEQLKQQQQCRCAICGESLDAFARHDQHIDHDHDTGDVRGGLCRPCNQGLGFFKDSISLLKSAIAYLKLRALIPPLKITEVRRLIVDDDNKIIKDELVFGRDSKR